MSITRNNHYVPQWYQKGFFEPAKNTLRYLDMRPEQIVLADGRVKTKKPILDAPTSRAFQEKDLYSTFFGTSVNDEIERKLFGAIDGKGSTAVRAFAGDDISEWHQHFHTLFEYIDIQKIRTPKGLDWVRAQYPSLTQNELMYEMQGIRLMHGTIWTEGVREIVSAADFGVKFIISDHPVTIYNYAVAPQDVMCAYPGDPGIALKASQTIFPLNRDFCLVLTNLEYAKDPTTDPLRKRTFARNFGSSIARTDAFIRTRKLSTLEVTQINYILKARARRYIAAGRDEWLYPERTFDAEWKDLRSTLLPPKNELWHFGGELYVRYESGHVHYQDAFGRTEQPPPLLLKQPPSSPRPGDPCGCGSGKRYRECCKSKSVALRPTWLERSIRERNLFLHHAIVDTLGLGNGKDWVQIRRELTDDQIRTIYGVYASLWPLETDLLQLLPKPDGTARAVYTGSVHPETITEFALGSSLYFGELIIESPFINARAIRKEYSPVENPKAYRQEFLKSVVFFLNIMPLVNLGLVNLIPDPCNFDRHLQGQMMQMATARFAGLRFDPSSEPNLKGLMERDAMRGLMLGSRNSMRAHLRKISPDLDEAGLDETMHAMEILKERDILLPLQKDCLTEGGQFTVMKLVPNFEIAMYLAQATGACIVTDSLFRWNEIRRAIRRPQQGAPFALTDLAANISRASFRFPKEPEDIQALELKGTLSAYPALMRQAFKYLTSLDAGGRKPNFEAHLASHFAKAHPLAQKTIEKLKLAVNVGRIACAFPVGGIQDNTINRLLLMSSSEHHLPNVPMAFFIDRSQAA